MGNIYFNKSLRSEEEKENLKILASKVENASTNALINISTLRNLDNTTKENLQKGNTLNSNLEENISSGNNLNDNLINNIRKANDTNTNLVNNSNFASSKNTELQKSLAETKKYIANLDESQNLPQMRNDITDLQNGMKNNQSISYEGKNLVCNNTLNGRTEEMVIEGKTLQNLNKKSTYFFSSDTTNVGRYEIVEQVTNSVVLNIKKELSSWSYLSCGAVSKNLFKANTKYTLVGDFKNVKSIALQTADSSHWLTNSSVIVNNKAVLTTKDSLEVIPDGFSIIPCAYLEDSQLGRVYAKDIIILEGDWTDKEIPSYFEDIKSVGDLNNNKVNIISRGKNLFNINEVVKKKSLNDSGQLINANDRDTSDYIRISSHILYAKNSLITRMCEYDECKNLIKSNISPKFPINLELRSSFVRLTMNNAVSYSNMMVSNQESEYENYQTDKKEISLPITDGLKSLPNGVCDRIYEKDGEVVLEQNIGKVLINDSTSIIDWNVTPNTNTIGFICETSVHNQNDNNSNIRNYLCDRFNSYARVYLPSADTEGICDSQTKGYVLLRISREKISTHDINGFKKWLQANPTTVYYQLAEPIYYDITNLVDIDLDTYDGLTYVDSENGIKPILDFKVPSNLASIVQSNSKAINELYELIDRLLIPNITNNTMNIALK